jgi:hypothetical protein
LHKAWKIAPGATEPDRLRIHPKARAGKNTARRAGWKIDQEVADGEEQTREQERPSHRRAPQSASRGETCLETRHQVAAKEDLLGNRDDENLRKREN